MGDFKRRPLGVLDRIYGFVSGKTQTSSVQLETPITVVHDVSREAELGTGFGQFEGYRNFPMPIIHAGATTERDVWDPYFNCMLGVPAAEAVSRDELSIWLIKLAFQTDTPANWTNGRIAVALPAIGPNTVVTYYPLGYFDASLVFSNDDGTGGISLGDEGPNSVYPLSKGLPFHFPNGALLTVQSVSSGAVNNTVNAIWWMGRKGTTPPGMR